MFGAPRSVIASGSQVVPSPRRPLDPAGHGSGRPVASGEAGEGGEVRRWYEDELGWPTAPGDPVRLVVGARFDVLDVPAEAGRAALRHLGAGSPVALREGRMWLLVAPGSAEELPGLLEWLEWGSLPLGLTAIGAGELVEAPLFCGVGEALCGGAVTLPAGAEGLPGGAEAALPAGAEGLPGGAEAALPGGAEGLPDGADEALPGGAEGLGPFRVGWPSEGRPVYRGPVGSQGAAEWLRPPEPGCEVEASLPTLSAMGGGGDAPDLVRLVDTVATHCHRVRLRRAGAQPPALRAQGRW
ncbi:SCO3374 family protein [Streptomyces venetus]|uniref:SCO3374 family protein n=1 Tax=Streptomyces venetus TaxID=1701086 RepID=UPI003C2E0512